MLIKSIDLKNNEVFGDINFDFCDSNGIPHKTIIFAGENGSGKSTILNIIYSFCETMYALIPSNEIRKFVVLFTEEEKEKLINSSSMFGLSEMSASDIENEITIVIDYSKQYDWNAIRVLLKGKDEKIPFEINGQSLSNEPIRSTFKGIFSDVEVNYTPNEIRSTSTMEIDTSVQPGIKSSNNLATEITQLLIDIESLDNGDFADWARRNRNEKVSMGISDKRMSRFKNAFNEMFTEKRFKRVSNTDNGKNVLFEEYGKEISIKNLSSGEKQIVFRGSFLLKDKIATQGAIVLIDEPEISLHPKWQLKILTFYKNLFTNENNEQTSQIFVSTHSPFVIHNNNRVEDKIIVLNKDERGIYILDEPQFFGWTNERVINQAFDIHLNFEQNKTVVLVEGPTDEKYINHAIKLFNESNTDILVQWIGRKDNAGDKFTGESALNQTKQYLLSNKNLYKNRFILLYDSDTKVANEDLVDSNLYVRRVPLNSKNHLFKKGIENLLTLPSNFNKSEFYNEKTIDDGYGGETITKKLDKIKLCNWICNEISVSEQQQYLNEFKSLIVDTIIKTYKK